MAQNIKIASTEAGSIPYYSKLFTVDLFGLNTKELAKNPAGGKYLNNNMFDIVIITSGQFGTDCIGLKKFYKSSRKIIPTTKSIEIQIGINLPCNLCLELIKKTILHF